MSRRIPGAAVALALFALAAVSLAAPKDQEYSALNGGRTYNTYCAGCHGVSGTGDGYIAETLRARPTDLTLLAQKNGGAFPEERVAAVVDGQVEVRTHGKREMPVWGDVFLWPDGDTPERREIVQRKIGELIAHLKAIQKPTEQKD